MALTREKGLVFHVNQYVHGLWFVPNNTTKALEDRCDWLCCLWRELDEPDWYIRYRVRYPNSLDPWAKVDTRHWHTLTAPGGLDPASIARGIQAMAQAVATTCATEVIYLPMACDGERALTLLAAQPWMHMREVPDDDAT
jgi:hypothetical protein